MTLTIDRDGERLDSALSRLVPELTRSQAQRLIEQGAVTQAEARQKNEKAPRRDGAGAGNSGGARNAHRGAGHSSGGLL